MTQSVLGQVHFRNVRIDDSDDNNHDRDNGDDDAYDDDDDNMIEDVENIMKQIMLHGMVTMKTSALFRTLNM